MQMSVNDILSCIICIIQHIILLIVDNIGKFKDLSYIFLNIALGLGAYKGLGYLKTYKEKRNAATFTFWVQLRVRMMEIKCWLEQDYGLINYLYDEDTRGDWVNESAAVDSRISIFKNMVVETIQFIKSTPDQMPAYVGWVDDYNKFISFLNDIIQFDISDGRNYFKFEEEKSVNDRDCYIKDICNVMDRMCNKIVLKQRKIETELELDEDENMNNENI